LFVIVPLVWGCFWTTLAPMPIGLSELCGANVDGTVYAIGKESTATLAYDVAANSWDSVTHPARPYATYNHACQSFRGKMFVFGGMFAAENKIQVYDPIARAWDATTYSFPLVFPGGAGLCTAVVDDLIYVGGGARAVNNYASQNFWYSFNPVDGTWVKLSNIVTKRNDAACGSDGKSVVMVGGTKDALGSPNGTNTFQIYTIANNSWTAGIPVWWYFFTNHGNAAFMDQNKVVFGGGENKGVVQADGVSWNNVTLKYVKRDGVNVPRTGWWPVSIAPSKVLFFGGAVTRGGPGETKSGMVTFEPIPPFS